VSWQIAVDVKECIGSGMCAGTAPEHFRLIKGTSSPIQENAEPDEAILDAANSCPVEAITVRDAADGTLIAPSL
jgi:ferredoxin